MLPPDDDHVQAPAISAPQGSADAPLIDLRRVGLILRQRLLLIGAVTFATVLIALTYVLVTPKIYTAQSVILVDPREMSLTDANEVLKGIGSDSAAITSQVAVLRSRELLLPVFDQLALFNDPEFAGDGAGRNATFERILRNLSVDRQGLTYVLEISFKSRTAEKAARITNAIVQAYLAAQVSEKSRANTEVNGLLEGHISGLRQTVAEDDARVQDFKAQSGMLDVETGKTLLQSQIALVNQQALEAHERARQALNRYNQAKNMEGGLGILAINADILSSSNADQLRNEYNQRSVELSRLSQTFGTRHPEYRDLTSQLEKIKALMSEETRRIVLRLDGDVKIARNDVAKAQADLAALESQADTIGQREVELRQLEMQAQTSREILQQFLRRAQETSLLDNMQRSEARVLSPAVPPVAPSWPKPSLMVIVAAMIGIVMGTFLALLLGPVETRGEASTTPQSPEPRNRRLRFRFPGFSSGEKTSAMALLGKMRSNVTVHRAANGSFARERLLSAKLEVREDPTSEFSFGIWSLIGRLFDILPRQKDQHVIAFTGMDDAIEKYRLTYNTALALERLGASVLVVDLDPLDENPSPASHDLISAPSSSEPLKRTRIVDFATRLPVLRLQHPQNAPIVLDARFMDNLLAKAAGYSDFIVVNAMPLKARKRMVGLLAAATQVVLVLNTEEEAGIDLASLEKSIGKDVVTSRVVVEACGLDGSRGSDPLKSDLAHDSEVKKIIVQRQPLRQQ